MEDEHCGVLSITANKLVRASKGEILARLDGDIEIHTPNWAEKLCKVFDTGPKDLAIVGPKQLTPEGTIHSFGDFLLHPKGYHHVCLGLKPEMVTRATEVDHVMGCFYCCTRALFDELEGFDEDYMRGQTVDFGMRARLAGYRCWAIPQIEFTHRHTLRQNRATTADSDEGVDNSRQVFREKWGFDRIAPDLDVVREHYTGTPLLWNAQVFGVEPGEDTVPASKPPTTFDESEWARFNTDSAFRHWAGYKAKAAVEFLNKGLIAKDRPIVVPDCGSGLVVQIMATLGVQVIGIEREEGHVRVANEFARHHGQRAGYPGKPPIYLHQTDLRRLPLDDGMASLVCLFDRMEAHDNPVSLVAESKRISGEDGAILAISKTPVTQHEQPLHPYRPPQPIQMASLIKNTTGWKTVMEVQKNEPGIPMIVFSSNQLLSPHAQKVKAEALATLAPATAG